MATSSNLPLAVQMYTLRMLPDALDTVLGHVAATGYRGIETTGDHGLSAGELQGLLQKHNLRVVASHVGIAAFEADPDKVIDFNLTIGNDVIVIPFLPQEMRPADGVGWQTLGGRLGKLGERCMASGVRLLYHNHDFEMVTVDGRHAIEWMLDGAAPNTLQWEADTAWIVRGKANPVKLLQQYTGRVPRVHVKDLSPAGTNEEEKGFADVGYGTLDWETLMPVAKAAGAEWYIVEHDLPPDPLNSIRRSFDFLSKLLTRTATA